MQAKRVAKWAIQCSWQMWWQVQQITREREKEVWAFVCRHVGPLILGRKCLMCFDATKELLREVEAEKLEVANLEHALQHAKQEVWIQ